MAVLLLIFLGLALFSARDKSVTVDELGHLPSGLYTVLTGDARYSSLNPPLVNALSALPVLLLDLERELEPPTPSEDVFSCWATGYQFLERHRADYVRIYDVARVVPILIVAALAVMLFVWARRLAPEAPDLAGVLAAGLLLSSPNVIAQARLVGTDTGTAFFVVLALVVFRAMLLRPTAVSVLLCGAALGLAQLTKFYALLLYPTLLALVFAWHALSSEERPRLSQLLGCYACAAANGSLLAQVSIVMSVTDRRNPSRERYTAQVVASSGS